MHAVCPNDPNPKIPNPTAVPYDRSHKTFSTMAVIAEDWAVDAEGKWIKNLGTLSVVNQPQPTNSWVCLTCGVEAKVESGVV